jgi:crotonobetainyl-CoA:carnitine CoA-transferase CaiB-like acyl-CoA transferase
VASNVSADPPDSSQALRTTSAHASPAIPTSSEGSWLRTVGEAIRSPEARERQLVTRIPHPQTGWIPSVALPIRYSRTPIVDPVAAPSVGQHTNEVLHHILGYGEDRMARLAEEGAFGDLQRKQAAQV